MAAIRNSSKGNVISRQLCEKDLPFILSLSLSQFNYQTKN